MLVRMTLSEALKAAKQADWSRADAMTDEEVMAAALADPDAQPITDWYGAIGVPRVKAIRQRFGLSQREFARMFRIPLGSVRDWEQGRARPEWTAAILLKVIERHPEAVVDVLSRFVSRKEAARRRGEARALARRARRAAPRKVGARGYAAAAE